MRRFYVIKVFSGTNIKFIFSSSSIREIERKLIRMTNDPLVRFVKTTCESISRPPQSRSSRWRSRQSGGDLAESKIDDATCSDVATLRRLTPQRQSAGPEATPAPSVSDMVSTKQDHIKNYPLGKTCITMNFRTVSRLFVVRAKLFIRFTVRRTLVAWFSTHRFSNIYVCTLF